MKLILSVLICIVFLTNTLPAFAAPTPTPTTAPQTQYTNEFTVDNQPSAIVELLQSFIQGFDSFIGGFIFYTPDPLGDKIVLKDKSEIPGITKYRDMFYHIALPILAIVIAGIAVSKLGSDNAQELKSFAVRFLITIILFITVPSVLSYSIQANNLLLHIITYFMF
jgi:ABC-type microcin C transport system permease subunit YejB